MTTAIIDEPYEKLRDLIRTHTAVMTAIGGVNGGRYGMDLDGFSFSAYPALSWRYISTGKHRTLDVAQHRVRRQRIEFSFWATDPSVLETLGWAFDEANEPTRSNPVALDCPHWKCHYFTGDDDWRMIPYRDVPTIDGGILNQYVTDYFLCMKFRELV